MDSPFATTGLFPAMTSLSSRIGRSSPAGFIEPCLPSPADKPPSGANWIHEIKHDGYRLMARRDPVGIGC
jgi:ATP-dependent DNA ligase